MFGSGLRDSRRDWRLLTKISGQLPLDYGLANFHSRSSGIESFKSWEVTEKGLRRYHVSFELFYHGIINKGPLTLKVFSSKLMRSSLLISFATSGGRTVISPLSARTRNGLLPVAANPFSTIGIAL